MINPLKSYTHEQIEAFIIYLTNQKRNSIIRIIGEHNQEDVIFLPEETRGDDKYFKDQLREILKMPISHILSKDSSGETLDITSFLATSHEVVSSIFIPQQNQCLLEPHLEK